MSKSAWVQAKQQTPQENQTIYFYGKDIGMFIGKYISEEFVNEYGVFTSYDVSYWRDYDVEGKNLVPLPPEETDFVEIPRNQQQLTFTAILSGEI